MEEEEILSVFPQSLFSDSHKDERVHHPSAAAALLGKHREEEEEEDREEEEREEEEREDGIISLHFPSI